MTSSTDTRNESFDRLDIGEKQAAVLGVILEYGPISDRGIAEILSRTINTITPRRGELLAAGHIRQFGVAKDLETGMSAATWERA